MPFYEYQCKACGAHHEAMQKMSDPPLKKCPECGRSRLVRLVSAPVFRLKGGGWYETDFKSDKETKRNLAAEEKAESGDKAAKSETAGAGDAKPAADAAASKPAAKPASKPVSKPTAAKTPARAPKAAPRRAAGGRPAKKAAKRR